MEAGPSASWRNLTHWNHLVRAKFMMDAHAPTAVSAIHHCCLDANQRGHPPPENGCLLVDHVPLERWHIRHMRQMDVSCRNQPVPTRVARGSEWALVTHPSDERLPETPLSPAWAAEVRAEARRLGELLAQHRTTRRGTRELKELP